MTGCTGQCAFPYTFDKIYLLLTFLAVKVNVPNFAGVTMIFFCVSRALCNFGVFVLQRRLTYYCLFLLLFLLKLSALLFDFFGLCVSLHMHGKLCIIAFHNPNGYVVADSLAGVGVSILFWVLAYNVVVEAFEQNSHNYSSETWHTALGALRHYSTEFQLLVWTRHCWGLGFIQS